MLPSHSLRHNTQLGSVRIRCFLRLSLVVSAASFLVFLPTANFNMSMFERDVTPDDSEFEDLQSRPPTPVPEDGTEEYNWDYPPNRLPTYMNPAYGPWSRRSTYILSL